MVVVNAALLHGLLCFYLHVVGTNLGFFVGSAPDHDMYPTHLENETFDRDKDWGAAAAHVMSPPFRPKGHQEALWNGLQSGTLHTTATDHCAFCAEQKAAGKDDFTKIPNGTAGVEERMSVIWEKGVNSGRMTPNEFVAITSTNAAQIFNVYPRKGTIAIGSDADIAIWDPKREITVTYDILHDNVGYTPYEGMQLRGWPETVISRGRIAVEGGDLHVKRGTGNFLERQPGYDFIRPVGTLPQEVDPMRNFGAKIL